MTDPAAPARTAQHIEPGDKPMRIEVIDYADYPDANLPPPNWEWRFYWVVIIALFVGVLIAVWRIR